jgi:hypothetical protein
VQPPPTHVTVHTLVVLLVQSVATLEPVPGAGLCAWRTPTKHHVITHNTRNTRARAAQTEVRVVVVVVVGMDDADADAGAAALELELEASAATAGAVLVLACAAGAVGARAAADRGLGVDWRVDWRLG